MKMTTNEKLTISHLKRFSGYVYSAIGIVILIVGFSYLWMLVNGGNPTDARTAAQDISAFSSAITFPIATVIGATWALMTARWMRKHIVRLTRSAQLAWICVGLGVLVNGLTNIVNTMLTQASSTSGDTLVDTTTRTIPAFASSTSLTLSAISYVLIFSGLLLLPGTRRPRISMVFDIFTTTICLLGLSWYLVTSQIDIPLIRQLGYIDPLRVISCSLVYPGADVLLLLLWILLLQLGVDPTVRSSLWLFGAGIFANIWADVLRAYLEIFQRTSGGYQMGNAFIDPFWIASNLLFGLAALMQYRSLVQQAHQEQSTLLSQAHHAPSSGSLIARYRKKRKPAWQRIQNLYIPLALVLCSMVLIRIFFYTADTPDILGVTAVSIMAGALIVIRHFFSARENEALLKERDERIEATKRVRGLVTQLTDIRDLDTLREDIVNIVRSTVGFKAVMLILVEKYNSPLTAQSNLLVSTTSTSMYTTRWKIRGDTILFRTVEAGERTEIFWAEHHDDLPPEVRAWIEKQQIEAMQFFPIKYQRKILGCLGVTRHELLSYDSSEIAILNVYIEQLSAIIEHAHLYQEAHEREIFAQAMANISKRLNAAVLKPVEVSELICQEGANALHAQYVILYIHHEPGQLKPLTAASFNNERTVKLEDWPAFALEEYEEEAAPSLQPVLIDVTQRRAQPPALQSLSETQPTPSSIAIREFHAQRTLSLRNKLARHYVQTAILAPLVSGGRILGMLVFARTMAPGASNEAIFDVTDLPLAQDFVKQASVTFANAQLYQRLSDANERLKELDQLKDHFMITASHELRTPLTAVQGYIELLVQYDEVLPDEQRQEFLQKAQLGCEELAVLLRNVMDASRLEVEAGIKPALMSRVPVKDLVEKVQVMIDPQVNHEKRQVNVNVPAHLAVYADPLRLQQVLMNISSNAIKYSPPGTPISFTGRIVNEQGRSVVISIADKGKGIDPREQSRLFQRFYRLESDMNSPIRGSGLGLYISRRLVEAMDGKIWIESTGVAGEGSTFNIQLPMA